MGDEVEEALKELIAAARLVVPTSDSCPLAKALRKLDDATEEAEALRFMATWRNREKV